jgi:prepilin-type N-terminal cleavage/methylation domain-containing protein
MKVGVMRKHIGSRLGFTLVELMVVIGIIAMLAAIALPNFARVRDKARETEVVRGVDTIRRALEQFAVDHNGLYPYRVHAYVLGGREITNTDEFGFAPMGIWGGCDFVDLNGLPDPSLFTNTLVEPVWNDDPLIHYSTFNQLTDPLKVYGYVPLYPRNPFLSSSDKVRAMGGVLWAFSGTDVTIPSPSVVVLPGDFVYTYNMGDPVTPGDAYSDRADPASVLVKAETYDVSSYRALAQYTFSIDLVDNYQLWGYGKLPLNGPMYSIYDNNDHAMPLRSVSPRKDWNGNNAKDEFEKGIVAYSSGGRKFFEETTSTGTKIEY